MGDRYSAFHGRLGTSAASWCRHFVGVYAVAFAGPGLRHVMRCSTNQTNAGCGKILLLSVCRSCKSNFEQYLPKSRLPRDLRSSALGRRMSAYAGVIFDLFGTLVGDFVAGVSPTDRDLSSI